MSPAFDTRVGAYGVVVQDGKILLARFTGGKVPEWTLPGGGLELGEDPEDAASREITEETGYQVELQGLLGVDSFHVPPERRISDRTRHLHALRIIYRARVIGGELCREVDGSTDDARWVSLEEVVSLTRVDLVDKGVALWRRAVQQERPGSVT